MKAKDFANYKPYPRVGESLKQIGQEARSTIPSIYISQDGISTSNQPKAHQPQPTPPMRPSYPKPVPQPFQYQSKSDEMYNKIMKWGFVIATLVVLGYAGFRLLFG